jgi:tRNA(Ile)-lysidine synthase
MNMFRGTGINGMAGIRIKQDRLLHPLLDFGREELQAIVTECGFAWATDATNEDTSFKRNHLRQELIPWLQANFAPDLLDKLSHLASVMDDADDYFKRQAATRFKKRRIEKEPGLISFEIKGLKRLSDTELYYFFKHCYTEVCGEEMDFFSSHFMAVKALMEGGGSAKLHLSNEVIAYREYDYLSFSWGELETPELQEQSVEEDRVWAVFGNYRFQFKNLKLLPKGYEPSETNVILDADDITWPLTIRSREPGDRFIPSGMSNHKKLKAFFIDAKVPQRQRDQVPIIADGNRILWVVGYRVDERALPKESSAKLLQIIAEPVDDRPKRMVRVKQKGKKK